MSEEFNLSDKIAFTEDYALKGTEKEVHTAVLIKVLEVKDVKEFIRKIKEDIQKLKKGLTDSTLALSANEIYNILEKRAGDKLVT